jgi:Cu2+-exporting ATPase
VVGPSGEKLAESSLQLAGMHCAACSGIIEQALARVAGVHSARVSAAAERATVCWDPAHARASDLIAAVRRAGYDAVPDAAAPARAMRRQEHRQALWRLFVAGFCAMQVMMMATPSTWPGRVSGARPAATAELGQLALRAVLLFLACSFAAFWPFAHRSSADRRGGYWA